MIQNLKHVLFIVPGERQKGACGVVDYAFQMAVAAARAGAQVLILPLYPVGQAETDFLKNLAEDLRSLIVMKEADGPTVTHRIRQFRGMVEDFRPDCISLQFYPKLFKTGRRYLPALSELAQTLDGWPVTVTMHETWTKLGEAGMGCWIKKWIRTRDLKQGLGLLKPRMLLVSTEKHLHEVTKEGFPAEMLPIISNIVCHELPEGMDLSSLMVRLNADEALPAQSLSVLFFARIIPTWDPQPFVVALQAQAAQAGQNPVIISVGETGYGDQGWLQLKKAAGNLSCIKLGKRSAEEVSWLLQLCDWGFSSTPMDFWMKSSSCAAMVTHGLPIVFSSGISKAVPPPDGWITDPRGFKSFARTACKGTHVTCVHEVWKKYSTGVASVCSPSAIQPANQKQGSTNLG